MFFAADLFNAEVLVSTDLAEAETTNPSALSGEDSNSLHLEQLTSNSPTRSPHASKAGWTVSGKDIISSNYSQISFNLF